MRSFRIPSTMRKNFRDSFSMYLPCFIDMPESGDEIDHLQSLFTHLWGTNNSLGARCEDMELFLLSDQMARDEMMFDPVSDKDLDTEEEVSSQEVESYLPRCAVNAKIPLDYIGMKLLLGVYCKLHSHRPLPCYDYYFSKNSCDCWKGRYQHSVGKDFPDTGLCLKPRKVRDGCKCSLKHDFGFAQLSHKYKHKNFQQRKTCPGCRMVLCKTHICQGVPCYDYFMSRCSVLNCQKQHKWPRFMEERLEPGEIIDKNEFEILYQEQLIEAVTYCGECVTNKKLLD